MFRFLTKPPIIVPILLGVMGLTCILSMSVKSPTVDEFAHLPAGYYYWKTGDFSLYDKSPPLIRLLCALPLLAMNPSMDPGQSYREAGDWRPWVFGTRFMEDNKARYDTIFFVGRLPAVFLALLLGWYVFRWARELYGPAGGLLSLFLYSFSPNMLAHARLVTTDVGSACFMFMAVYYYYRSFHQETRRSWLGAGLCSGLAFLSKFTSLLLLPIFGLLLVFEAGIGKEGFKERGFLKNLGAGGVRLLGILSVALLIIHVCYGFQGSLKPLGATTHESRFFKELADSPLAGIPVPLPASYVTGLDRQKADAEQGVFVNYLRGNFSTDGWWYYFIYAFAVKTPIALHILILISIGYVIRQRRTSRAGAFLILPIVTILFVFSFFNRINVGLRYILPVFPFLFVWAGGVARIKFSGRLIRVGAAVLLIGYATASLSVFPDYLTFFNTWAGGPGNGHRHLLDSNLDWGQDLKRLKTYMEREGIGEVGLAYFGHVDPGIYGIRYHAMGERPVSGDLAISANYLQGLPYVITYADPPVQVSPGAFQWLHAYEPKARIGNSIFVYSIPPAEN
jgi:hypothetical protein